MATVLQSELVVTDFYISETPQRFDRNVIKILAVFCDLRGSIAKVVTHQNTTSLDIHGYK